MRTEVFAQVLCPTSKPSKMEKLAEAPTKGKLWYTQMAKLGSEDISLSDELRWRWKCLPEPWAFLGEEVSSSRPEANGSSCVWMG